jgi:subtilisin family serine protease
MIRTIRAGLAAALMAATAALPVLVPAAPAAAATRCVDPGTRLVSAAWPEFRYRPEQLWDLSTGSGVVVAVVGSGVDGRHPMLHRQLARANRDFRPPSRDDTSTRGDIDCTGLGTQVAGVIAARPVTGIGFHGVAPGATIMPVTASGVEIVDGNASSNDRPGSAVTMANAILAVANAQAGVIVVPLVTYRDDPRLRAAVAYAQAQGSVVIAEVGPPPSKEGAPIPTPYPAAYDGVIGVGAVGSQGTLDKSSLVSEYVDIVGPGDGSLVSTQAGGGLVPVTGTGIAAGYVAGAAALVRSRWPRLTVQEVTNRLLGTTTPVAGGPGTVGYGQGMVNAFQAVSEMMVPAGPPTPVPALTTAPPDQVALRAQAVRSDTKRRALILAGAGGLAALLVILFAIAIPLGRKRKWRPGMATPPPEHVEDDLPSPPVGLFEER